MAEFINGKLQLPTVTACIIDCVNVKRAISVIEKCKSLCDFGAVKLLTSIETDYQHAIKIKPLDTLIMYSIFMLTKSYKYIDTSHVLIVQRDGWILNTSAWEDRWLEYDYIAPLFVQMDRVGSGGFSLRSKKIMETVSKITPEWNGSERHANEIQKVMKCYEDGVICLSTFARGFKIASLEDAAKFAQAGNKNPRYYVEKPFGFHGAINFVNHETGAVSPVCEHGGGCECIRPHLEYLRQMEV